MQGTLSEKKRDVGKIPKREGRVRPKPTTYFIFVNFFTQPQFEAWEFYTWKRVNARQKLSHDKTA